MHKSEFTRLVEAAKSSGKKAPDVSFALSSSLPECSSSVGISRLMANDNDDVVDWNEDRLNMS